MGNSLKIGIVSDEISLNFEEAVKYGIEWGIRDFEIRCLETGRIPFVDREEIDLVIKLIKKNNLNINALSPGFFKINFSEREKLWKETSEGLEKTFILADKLKINKIILFGGKREENWENGDYDRALNVLSKIANTGKSLGFTFLIENEPGFWLDTGENSAKMLKTIDSEFLRLNWDPGNAILCGETPYPDGYNHVKDYIKNFHIKEGRLKESGEWEFLTIDNGLIDWENMIRDIVKDTDVKILTVETHCEPLIENSKTDIDVLKKILEKIEK